MKVIVEGDLQALVGKEIAEIKIRGEHDPESASGTSEVEITLSDGKTILFFATDGRLGSLRVEVD